MTAKRRKHKKSRERSGKLGGVNKRGEVKDPLSVVAEREFASNPKQRSGIGADIICGDEGPGKS